MVAESRGAELARARSYLQSGALDDLVRDMLDANPWFCERNSVDFSEFTEDLLSEHDRPHAELFLVGSAALGFSLAPTKAGRRFRPLGGDQPASDFDVAMVDATLFEEIWNSMTQRDREGARWSRERDHRNVYWGRIDQKRVPRRTSPRRLVLNISSGIRRAEPFRGHSTSVRVYRRRVDLHHYTKDGLRKTARDLGL